MNNYLKLFKYFLKNELKYKMLKEIKNNNLKGQTCISWICVSDPHVTQACLGLETQAHTFFLKKNDMSSVLIFFKFFFLVNSSLALVNSVSLIYHRFQLPKVALVTEKLEFKFLDP